jgi:hypothetical protein
VAILAGRIGVKTESGETSAAGVAEQLMAGKGPVVSHDRGEAALWLSRSPDRRARHEARLVIWAAYSSSLAPVAVQRAEGAVLAVPVICTQWHHM